MEVGCRVMVLFSIFPLTLLGEDNEKVVQISTCVYTCFKPRGWSTGSIASNNSLFVEAVDQERRTGGEAFRNSDGILTFYSASSPVLLRSI